MIFTGIVIERSSSSLFQLSTVGVPVKFPSLSTDNPFIGFSVVIVVPGLFGVTTETGVIASFSLTGAGGVTFPVNSSATFGFLSCSSGIPSLSSSLSVMSGSPSPSVSLNTFTTTSFSTGVSPSCSTLTLIVTSRCSSIPSQSSIIGFPVTFPSLFTVKPFTVGAVIVLPVLFGVTTTSLV